jgi:hypothetical protein
MTFAERLAAARGRTVEQRAGEPDHTTLVDGSVTRWLTAVDDVIGRLLVGGLAYPDGELAPTLEGLADRAAALGTVTGCRSLAVLAVHVDALRPGPPDPEARRALAESTWIELAAFQRWLDAFRRTIGLALARAVSEGVATAPSPEDVPRMTARLFLDGMTFRGDEVRLHAHTADGHAVVLVDPVVGRDADDPFDVPLVSRLFQDELALRGLLGAALDVDEHPFVARGVQRVLRPDLRRRPTRVAAKAVGKGPHVRTVRVRPADPPEALGGEEVVVSDVLTTNLLARRVVHGDAPVVLHTLLHRTTHHPIGAVVDGVLTCPHLDPACWPVPVDALPVERASAGLRTALALVDRSHAPPARVVGWREAWAALRAGHEPALEVPADGPEAVWAALYRGDDVSALWETWATLPDPSLVEATARAMLLHATDPEAAVTYLAAHLDALRQEVASGEPMPPSGALLFAADGWAWINGHDRAGPVADALGLPVALLRRRVVQRLLDWVEGEEPAGLADTIALASASGWGRAVLVG